MTTRAINPLYAVNKIRLTLYRYSVYNVNFIVVIAALKQSFNNHSQHSNNPCHSLTLNLTHYSTPPNTHPSSHLTLQYQPSTYNTTRRQLTHQNKPLIHSQAYTVAAVDRSASKTDRKRPIRTDQLSPGGRSSR